MRLVLKRLSQKTLQLQRRRWIRKIRSKRKRVRAAKGQTWLGRNRTTNVKCPFALNISSKKNRQYTLKFLSQIRRHIIDYNQPVVVDLTDLQYILPTAALLMIAEFDRAKRLMGEDFRVSLIPSTTHRINAVLDQIGFSAICGTRLSDEEINEADDELVRHWRYASGERINDQTAKAFVNIQGHVAPALHKGIWKSISEAIGNTCLHAYMEERGTDKKISQTSVGGCSRKKRMEF